MTEILKPDFFIVGAPKAGTTSMADYLGRHPDIFMPYRKEMHFFGSDQVKIPHEFFVLNEKKYLKQFSKANGARRIGEASVMYLSSRTAAREIKAFNPDAGIIIMLRNPVDMLYAYHSQLLWGGYENLANFVEALDAERDRKQNRRIPRSAMMPSALYYRDVANYADQVERYLEVFGRGKVHIILFEDVIKDIRAVYNQTLSFLNIDREIDIGFRIVNPNKQARSQWMAEMIQYPPALIRYTLKLIPDKLRYWGLGKVSRLNTRYVKREPLDSELRSSLMEELAPDVRRLAKIIDRDLSAWCSGRSS